VINMKVRVTHVILFLENKFHDDNSAYVCRSPVTMSVKRLKYPVTVTSCTPVKFIENAGKNNLHTCIK
jgi:hypothetical protein